jgi:hypothetical protein
MRRPGAMRASSSQYLFGRWRPRQMSPLLFLVVGTCLSMVEAFLHLVVDPAATTTTTSRSRRNHQTFLPSTPSSKGIMGGGSSNVIEPREKWAADAEAVAAIQAQQQHQRRRLSIPQVEQRKRDLLLLLQTSATGGPQLTAAEYYAQIEQLVNDLEGAYQPAQTLPFFNMAQQGVWQLLFSTQQQGRGTDPQRFRLRELTQTVQPRNHRGNLITAARWELAECRWGVGHGWF